METRTYARHGDPQYASKTASGCEKSGEPVFLLRAQDRYAAAAVRSWGESQPKTEDGERLAAEAYRIADAMDQWPAQKAPD